MLTEDNLRTTRTCLDWLHDQKICSDLDDYRSIMDTLDALLLACTIGKQTEAIKAFEDYGEEVYE